MSSYDAAGTGCSPYVGIDSPWLIPLLTEEEISDKAGVGLKLTDDFLLIGKDGILFLSATPYEGGHTGPGKVMVAIDPTGPGVLWTTPIERSGSPAIGPDGTVYIYTVDPDNIAAEHHLVGLDPHTGDVVWRPTCEECVPQPYIPTMCEAGTYHPYPAHPDILIGPQGYLYACYRGCFVVFGSAPDRPVIRPWGAVFANVAFGARPVIGPDGTLYFLSLGDSGGYAVKAVAPDGAERWNTFISQYPQLSIEEQLHMVAGEKVVYVLVGEDGGNPRVVALNRERGNILWTQELVGPCGTPFVKFSRPVLGPSGLLYVLLSRADGEWLVVLVTQNGGEPYWVRVGDAVPPYAGRTNYSLLLAADDTLLVEAKQALVQIDGQTGEISSCIVPVPISVGSMAMASDGTVYTAGGGSHDVLMTVPNEPPRILSFQHSVESADENRARVRFEGVIEDPLGWNRSVILNWDYGDGNTRCDLPRRLPEEHGTYSTSFDSYHTYDLNATVSVELTVSVEGCSQIFATSEAVVCTEPPTIELAEATPGNVYAEETEVTFTCQAVPPGAPARQTLVYAWNFGDGESETVQTASHCYADSGEYTATVTVNVEGQFFQASQTVTVEVAGPPTLSISTTPNLVQPTDDGIKLDFTCQVEDPFEQEPSSFSWEWGFGDGETSFERSPSHIFQARGTYTASVTVELPGGEEFDTDFQVCAQSPVISALTAWPAPAYAGTLVEFSCSVPGCAGQAGPYSWTFGDETQVQSAVDLNAVNHIYANTGDYTVRVTVGTSPLDVTETTVLHIVERPQQLTAMANADPSSGIFPLTVNFTGAGAGPAGTSAPSYAWDFGDPSSDGNTSTLQNPAHTYLADDSYEAILTVTAGGGTAQASVSIDVRPEGSTETTLPCLEIAANRTETESGATTYSGNVVLNDFLRVGGSLEQSNDGSLTGSGGLTIQNNDYPIPFPSSFAIGDEAQDEDDNCYRLMTLEGMDNPPSDFTFL
jgi:PKD repeat protein/outer membrane protein assembly factor BamB